MIKHSSQRLIDATLASSGAAALCTGLGFMTLTALQDIPVPPSEWKYAALNFLLFTTYIAFVAFFVFLVGTIIVGLPTYELLRRLGRTTSFDSVLAGGMLSGVAAALLLGRPAIYDGASLAVVATSGAVGGWVFRRIAVAGAKPPPAPPSAAPTP